MNAPVAASCAICVQSKPFGLNSPDVNAIIPRRTANDWKASSNASLKTGSACMLLNSLSITVSTTTRLRALATAARPAAAPALNTDSAKTANSSIISRITSARICHFASMA
nr:hypothetical protein OG409_36895 [Streptomyces sp. NBC_00974]